MRPSARHRESATQFPPPFVVLSRREIERAIEAAIDRDQDEAGALIAILDDQDGDPDFEPLLSAPEPQFGDGTPVDRWKISQEHWSEGSNAPEPEGDYEEREPDPDFEPPYAIPGGGSGEMAFQAGDLHYPPEMRAW
jgi:hypothetical protein